MFIRFSIIAFFILFTFVVNSSVLAQELIRESGVQENELQEDERYYDDGRIHFILDNQLSASLVSASSPEGPIHIVTIRPIDESGQVAGASFLTMIVFENEIILPNLSDFPPEERALDFVVGKIADSLVEYAHIVPASSNFRLGEDDIAGVAFSIAGTRSYEIFDVQAGAIAGLNDSSLVFYSQQTIYDASFFDSFERVIESFSFYMSENANEHLTNPGNP